MYPKFAFGLDQFQGARPISGDENISSIEVEEALYRHPAVEIAAVVAMPHEKWGETPCAFVELAKGQTADAASLRAWCKDQLAPYKVPGQFLFMQIPGTSTGKIQKFVLRNHAREIAQNEKFRSNDSD